MFQARQVLLSDSVDKSIPSALAFSRAGTDVLVGEAALSSAADEYDLLLNWKLLLGKSSAVVRRQQAENEALSRILSRYALDEIASHYFGTVIKRTREQTAAAENPQVIVGIPALADRTNDWRLRYKKTIELAFARLELPAPRFFPEPFAVFQYHWNRGDIRDIGRHRNIMILDIGGGTTNICFIQTNQHGRLARGGGNHIPHGVRSIEVGGSDLDRFILDRLLPSRLASYASRALLPAAIAKERISRRLEALEHWHDADRLLRVAEEIRATPTRTYTLTAGDLKSVVEVRFWPMIEATLQESISELRATKLPNPLDSFDTVVLAGGTCQMGLIEVLVRRTLANDPLFGECQFLRSKGFSCAVAEGLAVEASANSRLHDIRPTRVAPYLQDDLRLLASHRRDALEVPRKLRARTRDMSTKLKDGVLISAPQGIASLVGEKIRWSFSLAQRPREVFLRFDKVDPYGGEIVPDFEAPVERVKLVKQGGEHSPDVNLDLVMKPDGFADVSMEMINPVEGAVIYNTKELDLHDLSGIKGSLFFGLDFGTSSTLASFVNLNDTSQLNPLPEQYKTSQAVSQRALILESQARLLLAKHSAPNELLASINDGILTDYIYHSNRIEGSQLDRGQTLSVLNSVRGSRTESSLAVLRRVADEFSYIDDEGNIKTASRPLKDGVAAVNLRDAFGLVREWAIDLDFPITSFYLRQLQGLVARGDDAAMPGQFRNGPVKIEQTSFVPPDALHVPGLIDTMFSGFQTVEFRSLPPLIQATEAHARFVSIHPFADGNGRVARLLANYFLWRANLPGILLPWENRTRYYDALEECNTKETFDEGNLSDLGMLFCDLFEDVVLNLEEAVSSLNDVDVPIIETKGPPSRMGSLLTRLVKQKSALDFGAQYKKWAASQEAMLAGVRQLVDELSRALATAWAGRVELSEFPLIDEDTYRSIRQRQRFSRTWYFKVRLSVPTFVTDLIFYFGPNSKQARIADESTAFTVSLHIARLEPGEARHVPLRDEKWSRVQEIVHNGSALGVLMQEDENCVRVDYESDARVENWFGALMEDVLTKLAGIDLSSIS